MLNTFKKKLIFFVNNINYCYLFVAQIVGFMSWKWFILVFEVYSGTLMTVNSDLDNRHLDRVNLNRKQELKTASTVLKNFSNFP